MKLLFGWWESGGRRWKSKYIGVAKRYGNIDGEVFFMIFLVISVLGIAAKEVEGKEKKREFWGSCGCCWFKFFKKNKKIKNNNNNIKYEREAVFQTKKKW